MNKLSMIENMKMRHCVLLTVLTYCVVSQGDQYEWTEQNERESAYVTVLACAKVFLRALYAAQASAELVDALLEAARLFGERCRLCGRDRSRLALDHDVKVDHLFGEGAHVVREAERVLARLLGGEDVVALSFALAVDHDHVGRVRHGPVNVERSA